MGGKAQIVVLGYKYSASLGSDETGAQPDQPNSFVLILLMQRSLHMPLRLFACRFNRVPLRLRTWRFMRFFTDCLSIVQIFTSILLLMAH